MDIWIHAEHKAYIDGKSSVGVWHIRAKDKHNQFPDLDGYGMRIKGQSRNTIICTPLSELRPGSLTFRQGANCLFSFNSL